jgi:hypothetical protein
VLDSAEAVPNGFQKIPYHIVFDVKYGSRQKVRLVARGTSIQALFKWIQSELDFSLENYMGFPVIHVV